MFDWLSDPSVWFALATLTLLEIVLGVDNIIFIAIIVAKLPPDRRDKARILGLFLAMFSRIALLVLLFWIMKLTQPLFSILSIHISGRDLILILGGLFLLYKSISEIYTQIYFVSKNSGSYNKPTGFLSALIQIAILDIIFSLDSVIAAVGMASQHLEVMIIAIVFAVFVMMVASKSISNFIEANPTIKTLALAFLILVGITLVIEGLGFNISKSYIYFAIFFSLIVEILNIYTNKKSKK